MGRFLKKYKLNSNGSFGALQWDAAEKLKINLLIQEIYGQ